MARREVDVVPVRDELTDKQYVELIEGNRHVWLSRQAGEIDSMVCSTLEEATVSVLQAESIARTIETRAQWNGKDGCKRDVS